MDITQALADAISAEKAIRRGVTQQAMADATGLSRHSVMRKLAGKREITMHELRGFAVALGTTATALMADAEERIAKSERASQLELPARQGEDHEHPELPESPLIALADARVAELSALGRVKSPGRRRSDG
jgi:transcriptional regulator with XRE-family HTH domain